MPLSSARRAALDDCLLHQCDIGLIALVISLWTGLGCRVGRFESRALPPPTLTPSTRSPSRLRPAIMACIATTQLTSSQAPFRAAAVARRSRAAVAVRAAAAEPQQAAALDRRQAMLGLAAALVVANTAPAMADGGGPAKYKHGLLAGLRVGPQRACNTRATAQVSAGAAVPSLHVQRRKSFTAWPLHPPRTAATAACQQTARMTVRSHGGRRCCVHAAVAEWRPFPGLVARCAQLSTAVLPPHPPPGPLQQSTSLSTLRAGRARRSTSGTRARRAWIAG